jgi:S-formylglutathione hydrolase FrmB
MKKLLLFFLFFTKISLLMANNIDTIQVYSAAMKKDVPCIVITPTGYNVDDSIKQYPTVYMLHGYSGDYTGYASSIPDIQQLVDKYQIIAVCPDGGFNSWYVDSPTSDTVRYETFTAVELVNYIDANYTTIKSRRFRAILGLSMGGHGALYLSFKHPETFGAAASMSGGVDFRPFPTEWELNDRFGNVIFHKKDWDKFVVTEMVDRIPTNVHFMLDCGIDDFFMPVNRIFHEKLLKAGIAHDYIERPGAHDWTYWANSFRYHLLFFQEYFDANNNVPKVLLKHD